MLRFVILRHEGSAAYKPGVHWDFMLEDGSVLKTWALTAEPAAGAAIGAERLADHRLDYLSYAGPVSGDRGFVSQWDSGKYQPLSMGDDEVTAHLTGKRLSGVVRLLRDELGHWTWRISAA